MTGKQEILGLSLSPELGKCGIVPPRGVTMGAFSTGSVTLKLGFVYLGLGFGRIGPVYPQRWGSTWKVAEKPRIAQNEGICALPKAVLL